MVYALAQGGCCGRPRAAALHRDAGAAFLKRPAPSAYPAARNDAADNGYIFYATDFGADPNATIDSTHALQTALAALQQRVVPGHPDFGNGGQDHGGATLHLNGGMYLVSAQLNYSAAGNIRICCGSLLAAPSFPPEQYLLRIGP